MIKMLIVLAGVCAASSVLAQDYPDMNGTWTGAVRTVSSGTSLSGEIAKDGALIADTSITLIVHHQEGEVWLGDSKNNETGNLTPVWGAIRSTGTEGIFVTATGGRGNIWFDNPTRFEFCFGSSSETSLSAYCGVLMKK